MTKITSLEHHSPDLPCVLADIMLMFTGRRRITRHSDDTGKGEDDNMALSKSKRRTEQGRLQPDDIRNE